MWDECIKTFIKIKLQNVGFIKGLKPQVRNIKASGALQGVSSTTERSSQILLFRCIIISVSEAESTHKLSFSC